ncbi:putative leader peptide [Streptomyces sp. NPDC058008]
MATRPFRACENRLPHHAGACAPLVARRHVDLLRVSSALCPGTPPRH